MLIYKLYTGGEPKLEALTRLAQPVNQLYYSGQFLESLDKPLVAVVGSRKVSDYGRSVTVRLVTDLARSGVIIVSGLALGVDSIAHKAALDAGGKTIAVLPGSLDKIYPASHMNLANQIIKQGGAIISEYPIGSGSPQKFQFIARNRIIAGLSQGILITEAANKSGSLHTANFGLEQGADIFAVPGNITSVLSEGTNNLIKNGAHPVTSAQDILEILNIAPVASSINKIESMILNAIKHKALSTDQLIQITNLDIVDLLRSLTLLEIDGLVIQSGPNLWSIS